LAMSHKAFLMLFYFFIPAARSRTTTLLRLHPSYEFYNDLKKYFCLIKDINEHFITKIFILNLK